MINKKSLAILICVVTLIGAVLGINVYIGDQDLRLSDVSGAK